MLLLNVHVTLVEAQSTNDLRFEKLASKFVAGYKKLNIKEFELSYKKNLADIVTNDSLITRIRFFEHYHRLALKMAKGKLSTQQRLQFELLKYQLNFDLNRARLEKKFLSEDRTENELDFGLSPLKDGKSWYKLYVDKYTSKQLTPEQIMLLGKQQVKFVTEEINHIKDSLGYTSKNDEFYRFLNTNSFFLINENAINEKYNQIQQTVFNNLKKEFTDVTIPKAIIKPSPHPGQETPPAYFEDGVFYYNFYGNRLNLRNLEYLYLHEGVPGHHYDAELYKRRQQYPLEQLFVYNYNGTFEGWAAYCEYLGKPLGLYQDIYSQIGRWQWDLVRSARVVLDVGIHYYGWTKDKARRYWDSVVPGQDDIANREINRCYNWPGQVLSYKVGAVTILQLKSYAKKRLGSQYNEQQFHSIVLARLTLPLLVLEKSVKDEIKHQLGTK